MSKELTLRVADAQHRDVGRGIVRIEGDVIKEYGLVSGDVVLIQGKAERAAPAIVWPGYPEDKGIGIIRIDGDIRGNTKVAIDDKVGVRKVDAEKAVIVKAAPNQPVRIVGGGRYLRRLLEGRPVMMGQEIKVRMLGNYLTFTITDVQPKGIVLISRHTKVVLDEKPIDKQDAGITITYDDIGGLRRELGLVREMIELPLRHPVLFERIGIQPPKGVLLHGPPGTGKTLIAKAVANETDASFIFISGPEVMAKYYGESEQRLRQIFEEASAKAPCIIFIDEIDSIAPKRDEVSGEKQLEKRLVSQLLTLMDGLESRGQVIVIAATNKPNLIDEALRRGGRFDREIEIGIPDRNGRYDVLQIHTRGMPLADDVNLGMLADKTHGFVGADIEALCKEAAMHALRRVLPQIDIEHDIPLEILDALEVTRSDFQEALKNTSPSALREVFIEVPTVRWNDIGGLEAAKQELIEAVEWPLKFPEVFDIINTEPPRGVLLFGPPGTGKTLLAKAVATESEANFISIKGPELFTKFVGESERGVREIFRKAKQGAPTVVFFDEVDALAPKRGASADSGVTERVISQILTEMDGLEELKDVVVVAATNRPDMIDDAIMRPGRIDRMIYVGIPGEAERKGIFSIHLKGKPLGDDVDGDEIAKQTEGYVGADIDAICREAAMLALRELIEPDMSHASVLKKAKGIRIGKRHLLKAMARVKPSVSETVLKEFENMAEEMSMDRS